MRPEYSNPQLPQEEINDSDRTPLRTFAVLAGGVVAVAVAAVLALAVAGGTLARHLPFETEVALMAPYTSELPSGAQEVERYLKGVAGRLIPGMALPAGMTVDLHYVDEPTVNAFATLGGHVVVFRGLLERVPDENVLAMVIAHEIGHVKHRHPITSLGRVVAIGAVVSLVSASAGDQIVGSVLGNSGMLTLLTFSRTQEEEADETAVAALVQSYGHAGGATDTFVMLAAVSGERGRAEPPKFLSTHPLSRERVERLARIVERSGWQRDGGRTPLPPAVRAEVEAAKSRDGTDKRRSSKGGS